MARANPRPRILRQHEDADAADVAFPAAELLVQGGVADNFSVGDGEQRKVAAKVDVLAPVANHLGLRDAMLDEHAFFRRDGEEEFVEFFLVIFLERPERALEAVLQDDFFWELLEF